MVDHAHERSFLQGGSSNEFPVCCECEELTRIGFGPDAGLVRAALP